MQQHNPVDRALVSCRRLIPPGSKLLAAVSGGSDSIALLHLLVKLKDPLALGKLAVAHVNHGLRGAASDEDERFVRRLCDTLEVACYSTRLKGLDAKGGGIEHNARIMRYDFLLRTMRDHGFDLAATGHTVNDQAETVLMRMMRGTGIRGLVGIHRRRDDGIVRPLLDLGREELRAWLGMHGWQYREDSSNEDVSLTRNRLRRDVIPILAAVTPEAVPHVASIADNASHIVRLTAPILNKWRNNNVIQDREYVFEVASSGLEDDNLAAEAIAELMREHGIEPGSRHVESVLGHCRCFGRSYLLPGGWRFYPRKNRITFLRGDETATRRLKEHVQLAVPGTTYCPEANFALETSLEDARDRADIRPDNEWSAFMDAGKCGTHLVFRPLVPDEPFTPLGRSKPVRVGRFLKKCGIDLLARNATGVVSRNDRQQSIIWIPGMRISDEVKVRKESKEILMFTCRRM